MAPSVSYSTTVRPEVALVAALAGIDGYAGNLSGAVRDAATAERGRS